MGGLDLNAMLGGLPETTPKVLELARALEHRGHREEAARLLKKAARVHADVRFDRARGALSMRMNKWGQAVALLDAALTKEPHEHHTMMMLCESLIESHQLDRAAHVIERIERRASTAPQLDNLRALLTNRRGAKDESTAPDIAAMSASQDPWHAVPRSDTAATQVPAGAGDATAHVSLPDGFLDQHAQLQEKDDDSTRAIPSGSFRAAPPRRPVSQAKPTGRLSPNAASAALLGMSGAPTNNDPTEAFSAHRFRTKPSKNDASTRALTASETLSALSEVSGGVGNEHTQAEQFTPPGFGGVGGSSLGDENTHADASSGAFGFGVVKPKSANRIDPLGDGFPDDIDVEDDDDDVFASEPRHRSKFDIPDPYATGASGPSDPISSNLPPRSGRLTSLSNTGPFPNRPNTGPHPAARPSPRAIDAIEPPSFIDDVAKVDLNDISYELSNPMSDPLRSSGAYASIGEQAPWREQVSARPRHEADVVQSQLLQSPWSAPEPEIKTSIPVFVPSTQNPPQASIPSPAPTEATPAGPETQAAQAASAPARKNHTLKILIALIVVLTVALLGGYGGLLVSDSNLDDSLRASLASSSKSAAPDTYAGYEAAVATLKDAIALPSAVGAPDDPLVPRDLPTFPGTVSQDTRSEVLARAAVLASIGEQRFAGAGGLDAAKLTEAAATRLGGEHPSILTARAYQALAKSPFEALKLAESGRMIHPKDDLLVEAQLIALGRLERLEQVQKLSRELRGRGVSSIRQRHVIGTVLATLVRPDAENHLRKILEDEPGHAPTLHTLATMLIKRGHKGTQQALILLAGRSDGAGPAWDARLDALEAHAKDDLGATLAALSRGAALPQHPDLELSYAEALIRAGDLDSAREVARSGDISGTRDAALLLGHIAVLSGDLVTLEEILKPVPNAYPRKQWLLGRGRLEARDPAGAIEAYEEAQGIDDYDGRSSALLTLARVHAAPHQREAFLKTFDKIAARSGATPTLLEASAKARVYLAGLASKRAVRKDLLDHAEKHLRVLITKDATPDLHFTLCEAMLLGAKIEPAAKECATGYVANPESPYGALLTSRLWLLEGKTKEAVVELSKLASRRPDDFVASSWLVRALIIDASFVDAQRELDRWLSKPESSSSTGQVLGGLIALNRGQSSAAATFFERGIEADPKNDEARVLHAYASIRTGLPADEVEDTERVLLKRLAHPDWGGYAWLALGELRRRQGKFSDAEENLGQALKRIQSGTTPSWMNTEVHLQRALAWQDRKGWDHPQVAKHLASAREVSDPDYPALLYIEGLYLLERRRPDVALAVERFTQALVADPNSCPTLKALAGAHKKARDNAAEVLVRAEILKHCE